MAIIRGTDKKNKLKGKATSDAIYGLGGNDLMDGGAGNDTLSGHDGADRLIGGLGNDSLDGGYGADNLMGGDGDDWLFGGMSDLTIVNDVLRGGDGNDVLQAGNGNDRLFGDDGNDSIYSQEGNDRLDGGDGNDYLSGGDGKDNLKGGDGDDNLNGGFDSWGDKLDGGTGDDTISILKNDVAIGGKGHDTLTVNATPDDEVVTHVNLSGITGKKAVDIGIAGARAGQFEKATINLSSLASGSTVTASKGDDTINVYSSFGVTINGGAGDDRITLYGDNTFIGGAGTDVFVLESAGLPSTISDFTSKDFLLIEPYFAAGQRDSGLDLASPFVSGSNPLATSSKGQFLYDTDDGRLFYDSNGTEIGGEDLVVTLSSKPGLTAVSFIFDF